MADYEISSDKMVLSSTQKEDYGRIISAPTTRLARNSDSQTSKDAAEKCESFRRKHESWIFNALHFFGDSGGTAKEIAAKTQMTDVQVNRRLSFMGGYEKGVKVRMGVIERTDEVRGGCHVWRIVK